MTRFLSEALEAPEPIFRLGLQRLEKIHGNPSSDIRLSTEVRLQTQNKLRELGVDPHDTTAQELYYHLQEKVASDDKRLTRTLQTSAAMHVNLEAQVVDGMIHALKQLPDSKRCYSIKNSSLKAVLKRIPPKKAVKQLGFRSFDSCLKHESATSLLAAAWLVEGRTWQQKLLDQYKKLQANDFEDRSIQLIYLNTPRWQHLAAQAVEVNQHNLLTFKEAGTLFFFPVPAHHKPGMITASLSLALHELNEIRAASTFLKLSQVKSKFGAVVVTIATDEPRLSSELLDQPVPWHLIQRYYARLTEGLSGVFEPHVEQRDLVWHPVEQALSAIEPSLKFWESSGHLGMLEKGKAVSLNVIDAALNCCNQLSFEDRTVHHFQRSLWNELLLRYLKHDSVEQTVLKELQPQLAAETVVA